MMIRRLLSNINVINITLVFLITYITQTYLLPSYKVEYKKQYQAKAKPSPDKEDTENLIKDFKPLPLNDYLVISDANLFHPERRIPPLQPQKVESPKPELVLYGTLISDDISVAYVEDQKAPTTTPGRGKRQRALRIGESIGGFVLREIHPDRIVLIRGEETMVVNVIDPKRKRKEAPPQPTPQPPPKK